MSSDGSPMSARASPAPRQRNADAPLAPSSPASRSRSTASVHSSAPKKEADVPSNSNSPLRPCLNVLWRFWCGLCDGLALLHVWHMLRNSRPMWNTVRDTMTFFCVWMGLFLFLNLFVSRWVRVLLGDDDQKWVFDQVVLWTWLVPLYLLSMILSLVRYQDIALGACEFKKRRSPAPSDGLGAWKRFLESMGDEAYRLLIVTVFLLGAKGLQILPAYLGLPTLGNFLYGVCCAWTASFYAFEYVWTYLGWTLQERVRFFENRWAYFAGFGLPLTVGTYQLSFFTGSAVYATAFPFLVMLAAAAQCRAHKEALRLRLFALPSLLANSLTRIFVRASRPPEA